MTARSAAPQKTFDADVIIVGGGPAGLSLTALLAQEGVNVICIDRDQPARQSSAAFDGRTIAVSYGSRKVLRAAGIWDMLGGQACPIDTIQITDGDSPVLLEFDKNELGDKAGGQSFGWIAEIRHIRAALFQRVETLDQARHMTGTCVTDYELLDDHVAVHLDNGRVLTAPLVIGADGRFSFTRDWMGIGTRRWSYEQSAIVCTVTHEKPHHNIAIENFRPEGPFAILPMEDDESGAHRSSIVWTVHGRQAQNLAASNDDTFNAALSARFPDWYGTVRQSGKRFTYPLGLIHAHRYIGPRMALIAEAGHGIHPIAGQGLNMGFRDVAALAPLIIKARKAGQDHGAPELLETYQRQRRFDNMAMAGTTDLLNRLFSNNLPPVRLGRRAGLRIVSRLPFAKQFFMKQAMGASGLLPEMIRLHENEAPQAADQDAA